MFKTVVPSMINATLIIIKFSDHESVSLLKLNKYKFEEDQCFSFRPNNNFQLSLICKFIQVTVM